MFNYMFDLTWDIAHSQLLINKKGVKMKKCDHCQKTEKEQGSEFDCEAWTDDGKNLLLCDDCFFNERYEGRKNYGSN